MPKANPYGKIGKKVEVVRAKLAKLNGELNALSLLIVAESKKAQSAPAAKKPAAKKASGKKPGRPAKKAVKAAKAPKVVKAAKVVKAPKAPKAAAPKEEAKK